MAPLKSLAHIVAEVVREWLADKAPTYAAALSYHMLLALAPLVIIAVAIISALFQSATTQQEIVDEAEQHLGTPAADAIQLILESVHMQPTANVIAMIVGGAVLLFMAASAFRALRKALDAIWDVKPAQVSGDRRTMLRLVLNQAFLLFLVLVMALSFAALVGLSALASTVAARLTGSLPASEVLLHAADFVVSWGIVTALFAGMLSVVPLARLPQRFLWRAAALTAFLFALGKLGFGIYVSHSGTVSLYGAAGSLVVFLIWVYYSAMILFFGAEWAKILARRKGITPEPRAGAQRAS
jgi:membrane protein